MTHRTLTQKEIIERHMAGVNRSRRRSLNEDTHEQDGLTLVERINTRRSPRINKTDDDEVSIMDKWGGDRRDKFGFEK